MTHSNEAKVRVEGRLLQVLPTPLLPLLHPSPTHGHLPTVGCMMHTSKMPAIAPMAVCSRGVTVDLDVITAASVK